MSAKPSLKLDEVSFKLDYTTASINQKMRYLSTGYPGVGSHGFRVPVLKLSHCPEKWRNSIRKKRIPLEILRSHPSKEFKGEGFVFLKGGDNHFGENKPRKIELAMPAFAWVFFLSVDLCKFPYEQFLPLIADHLQSGFRAFIMDLPFQQTLNWKGPVNSPGQEAAVHTDLLTATFLVQQRTKRELAQ